MSVEAKVQLASRVELEAEGDRLRVIATVYLPRGSMLGPMASETLKDAVNSALTAALSRFTIQVEP